MIHLEGPTMVDLLAIHHHQWDQNWSFQESCQTSLFSGMPLSSNTMAKNKKVQTCSSLSLEWIRMFLATHGDIWRRYLNWCNTNKKVRFHPSQWLRTLVSLFVAIKWS